MLDTFFLLVFVFFSILVQTALFSCPWLHPFKPDLTIPLTIYISLSREPVRGGFLVLLVGYLLDVFSAGTPGLYVFLRELMFFFTQLLNKRFFLRNILLSYFLVGVYSLAEPFLVFAVFKLFGKPYHLASALHAAFLPALVTAALSPFVFRLVLKWEKILKITQSFSLEQE